MDGLVVEQATKPSIDRMSGFVFPPALRKLCTKPNDADRLVCLNFKSYVHKTSPMEKDWAKALKGDDWVAPWNNLHRMYHDKDPSYSITVWFLNPYATYERLTNSCLGPLINAVKDHTPPFHQYLDENDEPMISFDLPSVHDIGNGMYRRYPRITDGTGKRVENRNADPTYFNLPKTVTWDSIKTFHITYGVPTVRDAQYKVGLHSRLASWPHGVFLQKLPVLEFDGNVVNAEPVMKKTFQAGVRLGRDKSVNTMVAIPEEGAIVEFEFEYSGKGKGKAPPKGNKERTCFGRVTHLGGRGWLEKTNTDFCVLLTLPKGMKLPCWSAPKKLIDSSMLAANIKVKVDHTATIRDQLAFKRFCTLPYEPELLDRIRLAFWSNPSKAPNVTDLTKGPAHSRSKNSKAYKAIIKDLKATRHSNKSQDAVLEAAAHMKSNITVVQGPPGAGKTRTLRDKAIALAKIGHKILCVASSNVAVDTDANAVWDCLSPEERKKYKCLRLETNGAERAARLTKVNYAHYTGEEGEADKMPEYLGPEEAEDNPAVRNGLDKLCMDFALREGYATKMLKQYEDYNEALQAVQDYDGMKRSAVFTGMTLDYRIWELTEEDKKNAEAEYNRVRRTMSEEEYHAKLASGEFSVDKFDKSKKYRDCISNYIAKDGDVKFKERVALTDATDVMSERVLKDTTFLFTTASNCGGELLENSDSFVPTIIFCDEAGQISIPSLCVPLTTFRKWEGLFLFGDIQQLEPTLLSGQFNEFIANGRVSPLALLAIKGFETQLLDTQYRMCPANSSFPREQFYDGKGLKDSDVVKVDNEVRKAIRKITLAKEVLGDNGEGSEYVVTDVPNGVSRAELNGTSLVNHANVDVIIKMIDRFIQDGTIKGKMIKILCYYQGQRRLLRKRINQQLWDQSVKDSIEISTVDAFQGRESTIVIVDLVTAKDYFDSPARVEDNTADDLEDLGGEDYIKVGVVTAHVRSPNRLNVALTRGKDATIVVCQASLCSATFRKNRGKQYNALANMIGNAKDRNYFLTDFAEDSHEDAVKARKEMDEKKLDGNRERQKTKNLEFIAKARENWNMIRDVAAVDTVTNYQRYRTRGGHTTRPIGNRALIEEADAYDAEQERIQAEEAEAENQRTLNLGINQSLSSTDFPRLPPKAPDASDQQTEMDTTADQADEEDEGDFIQAEGIEED